jgi:hypothetical protein
MSDFKRNCSYGKNCYRTNTEHVMNCHKGYETRELKCDTCNCKTKHILSKCNEYWKCVGCTSYFGTLTHAGWNDSHYK